jgi:hypothetical protein
MCQKAAGNFFMPLVNVQHADFSLTRGAISWFQSSDRVRRGFCSACGTPLAFVTEGPAHLNVTIGSLDDPKAVKPISQDGVESRLPWLGDLDALPEVFTPPALNEGARQHPDHDTNSWPVQPPPKTT